MTSSPGPIPSASRTITIASVPLATPTVSGTPRNAAASSSNAFTFGPRMNFPDSSTSAKAACRRGISGAYCALTSTSGIGGGTASQSRGAPPQPEHDAGDEDHREHDVVDVVERMVEALPVGP